MLKNIKLTSRWILFLFLLILFFIVFYFLFFSNNIVINDNRDSIIISNNDDLVFKFSSKMDRKSVVNAFYINPVLDGDFEWKSDKELIFKLKKSLKVGDKVVVNFGTSAKNWLGKNLKNNYSISYLVSGPISINMVSPVSKSNWENLLRKRKGITKFLPSEPVLLSNNEPIIIGFDQDLGEANYYDFIKFNREIDFEIKKENSRVLAVYLKNYYFSGNLKISLSSGIPSSSGQFSEDGFSWEFHSELPILKRVVSGDEIIFSDKIFYNFNPYFNLSTVHQGKSIEFEWNRPVEIESFFKALSITPPRVDEKNKLSHEITRDESNPNVLLLTFYPNLSSDTKYIFNLDKNIQSLNDKNLVSNKNYKINFHTPRKPCIEYLNEFNDGFFHLYPEESIKLSFCTENSIPKRELEYFLLNNLEIKPDLFHRDDIKIECNMGGLGNVCDFIFNKEFGNNFSLGFSDTFIDVYNQKYDFKINKFIVDKTVAEVEIKENFILPKKSNSSVNFNVKNIESLDFYYCPIKTDENLNLNITKYKDCRKNKINKKIYQNISNKNNVSLLLNSNDENFFYWNLIAKSSTGNEITKKGFILFSNIKVVFEKNSNKMLFIFVDSVTGFPKSNLDVSIFSEKEKIYSGKTDKNGFLIFESDVDLSVFYIKSSDELVYFNYKEQENTEDYKIIFDKNFYSPEDKVSFIILFNGDEINFPPSPFEINKIPKIQSHIYPESPGIDINIDYKINSNTISGSFILPKEIIDNFSLSFEIENLFKNKKTIRSENLRIKPRVGNIFTADILEGNFKDNSYSAKIFASYYGKTLSSIDLHWLVLNQDSIPVSFGLGNTNQDGFFDLKIDNLNYKNLFLFVTLSDKLGNVVNLKKEILRKRSFNIDIKNSLMEKDDKKLFFSISSKNNLDNNENKGIAQISLEKIAIDDSGNITTIKKIEDKSLRINNTGTTDDYFIVEEFGNMRLNMRIDDENLYKYFFKSDGLNLNKYHNLIHSENSNKGEFKLLPIHNYKISPFIFYIIEHGSKLTYGALKRSNNDILDIKLSQISNAKSVSYYSFVDSERYEQYKDIQLIYNELKFLQEEIKKDLKRKEDISDNLKNNDDFKMPVLQKSLKNIDQKIKKNSDKVKTLSKTFDINSFDNHTQDFIKSLNRKNNIDLQNSKKIILNNVNQNIVLNDANIDFIQNKINISLYLYNNDGKKISNQDVFLSIRNYDKEDYINEVYNNYTLNRIENIKVKNNDLDYLHGSYYFSHVKTDDNGLINLIVEKGDINDLEIDIFYKNDHFYKKLEPLDIIDVNDNVPNFVRENDKFTVDFKLKNTTNRAREFYVSLDGFGKKEDLYLEIAPHKTRNVSFFIDDLSSDNFINLHIMEDQNTVYRKKYNIKVIDSEYKKEEFNGVVFGNKSYSHNFDQDCDNSYLDIQLGNNNDIKLFDYKKNKYSSREILENIILVSMTSEDINFDNNLNLFFDYQKSDGGFGFYKNSKNSNSFLSAELLFMFSYAKNIDLSPYDNEINNLKKYLLDKIDNPKIMDNQNSDAKAMIMLALMSFDSKIKIKDSKFHYLSKEGDIIYLLFNKLFNSNVIESQVKLHLAYYKDDFLFFNGGIKHWNFLSNFSNEYRTTAMAFMAMKDFLSADQQLKIINFLSSGNRNYFWIFIALHDIEKKHKMSNDYEITLNGNSIKKLNKVVLDEKEDCVLNIYNKSDKLLFYNLNKYSVKNDNTYGDLNFYTNIVDNIEVGKLQELKFSVLNPDPKFFVSMKIPKIPNSHFINDKFLYSIEENSSFITQVFEDDNSLFLFFDYLPFGSHNFYFLYDVENTGEFNLPSIININSDKKHYIYDGLSIKVVE